MQFNFCSVTYQNRSTLCNQTYLTTIDSNSWECSILSLSQLLPDTLPDLISDTRSALLRDSLWWEAGKEDGNNSDQKHRHLGSCLLWTSLLDRILCAESSQLTVGKTVVLFIGASLSELNCGYFSPKGSSLTPTCPGSCFGNTLRVSNKSPDNLLWYMPNSIVRNELLIIPQAV